jgi:NitT/TauT family transport system ATP-binding protein
MARLRARELTKTYGEAEDAVRALSGVDFAVADGEFVVVIGPSGSGKSTLLSTFAGLVEPTSGAAVVDGEPVAAPGPDRAVVFQSFELFPWRTALGNAAFGLEMTGVPADERERRAREQLDRVGLADSADRYPGELSGGQRQRVGLARALAVDPEVLLMDEPFGALDAQTRAVLRAELLRIWEREGTTVLFVTHDIDEALVLGDRVLVLGPRGRLVTEREVPFERPRFGRDIELSDPFRTAKRDLREVLRRVAGDDA